MKILNEEMNDELVKEVGKFTILWANFEEKYCHNDCNPYKIRELKCFTLKDEGLLIRLAECMQGRDLFTEEGQAFVAYNVIPKGAKNLSDKIVQEIKNFVFLNDYSIVGALQSIYRVRNNLVHGLKISALNGQIELFKSMNDVLEDIESNN